MELDASNLPALARGCAILGAGGGGDTEIGLAASLQATEDHGPVQLVDLEELPDEALLMPCGGVGAPTVSIEKIESGDEGGRLREMVQTLWNREVVALMSAEIGGSNGIIPVVWAARIGLPVVDADGMGRAFPEIPQVTMEIAGISPNPAVMTDERGNVIVFRATDGDWMERMERAAAVEFGGMSWSSEYQLTVGQAKAGAVVNHAVSLAIRLGTVVAQAEHDPVEALADEIHAARLIVGKIVDVERRTTAGFVRGSATIEGLDADAGRTLRLEIQNENLVALEGERALAMVPDIITVLDSQSANAISTERLRYGQRVTVIAFPCDPIWRTARGLELAGPRHFGYDLDYTPVEDLHALA